MSALTHWLRRGAESTLVLMMAAMFAAFILQVLFRYALNLPVGWTDEVCTLVWLWGILWGASFVMKDREDIRFDMIYSHLPRGVQRVFTVLGSGAAVALLLGSLPATWSYVTFMKVERTSSFGIPYSWVFSIYIVFVLAMTVRHARIAWRALHNRLIDDGHVLGEDPPAANHPSPT